MKAVDLTKWRVVRVSGRFVPWPFRRYVVMRNPFGENNEYVDDQDRVTLYFDKARIFSRRKEAERARDWAQWAHELFEAIIHGRTQHTPGTRSGVWTGAENNHPGCS